MDAGHAIISENRKNANAVYRVSDYQRRDRYIDITENLSNQILDPGQTERPSREYPNVRRTDSQTLTTRGTDDETLQSVLQHSYQKRLFETLQHALRTGYNGVDVVHREMQSLNGFGLQVWQATKWETESRSTPEDSCQRYDFRYYDHVSLLASLSDEEWPGTEGREMFDSRK